MHQAIRFAFLGLMAGRLLAQPFAVPDTTGSVRSSADWSGHPAIVLFFVAPECPLSNSYVPEMNRIQEAYGKRGVLVYAILPDIDASPGAAARYKRDYRYAFPLLLDRDQALVRLAGATVTPQVAVVSSEGKVLYLGRIDNRAEDFGKTRTQVTSTDLRDALDAVLAGRPVARPHTKSIGCAIPQTQGDQQ